MRLLSIVGARPQFVKASVLTRAVEDHNRRQGGEPVEEVLVHTGQHYDDTMSAVFFRELELRQPDHHLGIHGGGHGDMTGRMLQALEPLLQQEQPDLVVVHGDTNSTMAGALAATKLHLPTAHVEAGLRSFNRRMPEELNRIVADAVSDLLFAPTEVAVRNLRREGVPEERIHLSGDVMYDAALHYLEVARRLSDVLARLGLLEGDFVLATVHRAENTDDPGRLREIIDGLSRLAVEQPVVMPLHPRTANALSQLGLGDRAAALTMIEPVGYLDMLRLEEAADLVVTDSGGVQKEAFFVGTPCITLRDETEWVELLECGAARLAGASAERIARLAGDSVLPPPATGLYGDGSAGERIVTALLQREGRPGGR